MFVGSGVLGTTLATTLGLRGTALAASPSAACSVGGSDAADAFIKSAATALLKAVESNPEAPGVRELDEFVQATYPAEPDSEDHRLLQGAIYLQLQSIAEMYAAAPSEEAFRERLANPSSKQRNPEYYNTLLARTKERVACDPAYAEAIAHGAEQARTIIIECTGVYYWCWVMANWILDQLLW
jgi:hypothetical protein